MNSFLLLLRNPDAKTQVCFACYGVPSRWALWSQDFYNSSLPPGGRDGRASRPSMLASVTWVWPGWLGLAAQILSVVSAPSITINPSMKLSLYKLPAQTPHLPYTNTKTSLFILGPQHQGLGLGAIWGWAMEQKGAVPFAKKTQLPLRPALPSSQGQGYFDEEEDAEGEGRDNTTSRLIQLWIPLDLR
ncbi:hypothetical protein PAAG_04861 [Paracoccidioides lutzii Pb01]|uniref:Uncharacterized protein n=1 Tax=Paracoccidioides lutzii (strain ATCC MYA-826 / Pb01) TaxID=502779 RepID=C1H1S5_PARBA|nr:hypothetical protein PAAG_04861 [Paracoccidioides lutzii Pb01]EEH33812.2 hypothetical protein PAAG_04861 [Paracoccidioides lutzii Pb01]